MQASADWASFCASPNDTKRMTADGLALSDKPCAPRGYRIGSGGTALNHRHQLFVQPRLSVMTQALYLATATYRREKERPARITYPLAMVAS